MKFLYLIFLLLSLYYKSQTYVSQWYTIDNGFPQNSVKDIVKDKYGFIWMTTENGIVRYDGENFQVQQNLGLNNLHFGNLRGNINNDSILAFNDYEKDAVLINKRKTKLITSNFENIFTLRNNQGYIRILKNVPTGLFISRADYYIKTNLGIYYFDNTSIKFVNNDHKEITINAKFNEKDLENVFVHDDHIFITDTKNRKTLVLHGSEAIIYNEPSLYNDPKSKIFWSNITGQVFVINNGNVYLSEFIKGKLKLTFIINYPDFEKNIYYSIYYDQQYHKLYLGTPTKGLNILTISGFNISLKNRSFEDEVFYSAIPFKKNSVITSDGTEYFKNKNKRLFFESASFYSKKTTLLIDNSENLVYIGDDIIYKRYKKDNYKKKDSFSIKNLPTLFFFKTEDLYIGSLSNTTSRYLYIFQDDDLKKVKNVVLFKDVINSVLKYNDDTLFVGCNDGLYIVSLSKNKIIKKIIGNIQIKQIIKTKDSNIWFTTSNNGFYLLKNNIAVRMPEDKNHYLTQAHYFLEDSYGNFWITSNNGLFKVRKKALLDYAENKKTNVVYYRYSKENGLLNNEFNGSCNPAGNKLEDGQFVFPSMEGLVFFKPDEVKSFFPKAYQLYIDRAVVDKKEIDISNKGLILKSDFVNAAINIDIPYYYDISNIYLEAKLDGSKNGKWEKIDDNRKYILNNKLNPGKYNLVVRFLVSEDGKFVYKTIPIEIEPYFYETLWFQIFIIVSGLLIIFWIIWNRTHFLHNELKKTNNTLEETKDKLKNESEYQRKLVESISHDITTPLKFIASLSQKLQQSTDPDMQKQCFESIYNSSEQLYKFTLGLKEYIHLHRDENVENDEKYYLYDLMESKKQLFQEIARQNGVMIQNFTDKKLTTVVNHNILSAIVHNIIDNAVKYTPKGEIIINTNDNDAQIEINITDTGRGMSNEQINYYTDIFKSTDTEGLTFRNYGLGLHMVIQLIKKIKSEISFQKNSPKGTIIKIIIYKH